jgi:hypothetical protein
MDEVLPWAKSPKDYAIVAEWHTQRSQKPPSLSHRGSTPLCRTSFRETLTTLVVSVKLLTDVALPGKVDAGSRIKFEPFIDRATASVEGTTC